MNQRNQLQAFGLFLFLLVVMSVSTASFAAVYQFPAVAGATRGTAGGQYTGSGTYSAGARSYATSGVVNINGKPISVPMKVGLKSGVGPLLKNAMKLNPWTIAGTLAAGWLIDQGLEWMGDQRGWEKVTPVVGTFDGNTWRNAFAMGATTANSYMGTQTNQCGGSLSPCSMEASAVYPTISAYVNAPPVVNGCNLSGDPATAVCSVTVQRGPPYNSPSTSNVTIYRTGIAAPTENRVPATQQDFDDAGDPTDTVAPELPGAGYSNHPAFTDGLIYQNPGPDFTNARIEPMGAPYEKVDGSTVQPIVKITPAPDGEKVRIEAGEVPLTTPDGAPILDAQGQPVTVATGTPQASPDTDAAPDPAPSKSQCELSPLTIGCSLYGDILPAETIPVTVIPATATVEAVGGAGSCPASVSVRGIEWSYQPFCDFASAIRPLIIGFAWLSFAYIVIGAVRS